PNAPGRRSARSSFALASRTFVPPARSRRRKQSQSRLRHAAHGQGNLLAFDRLLLGVRAIGRTAFRDLLRQRLLTDVIAVSREYVAQPVCIGVVKLDTVRNFESR